MKKVIIFCLIFSFLFKLFSQDASNDNIKKNENTIVQENKAKNGWEYYNEGKFYESIKALTEEKRNFPDRINIYVILGWNYLNLKDYATMEKVSLEGLKYSPDDIRILKNAIDAMFIQGKYSEIIPHLEKYIALRYNAKDPYVATVYYYLGVSFFNLNYLRKAEIALSTSLYYSPGDINAMLQSAETMIKLAQIEKAKNLFNSVLKIQANNTLAQDGLKRLENIQK